MTDTTLFVSSCSRRELARRRNLRRGPWRGPILARMNHPAVVVLGSVAVCAAAFLAGRGGL